MKKFKYYLLRYVTLIINLSMFIFFSVGCGEDETGEDGGGSSHENKIYNPIIIGPDAEGDISITVKADWIVSNVTTEDIDIEIKRDDIGNCVKTIEVVVSKLVPKTVSENMYELHACFLPEHSYTVTVTGDHMPKLSGTGYFYWGSNPTGGSLLVQKARNMMLGNHQFYEQPHYFNGEALDNLNNTGSVGWSYSFAMPTVTNYNSRLTNAWTTNQSDWLGYNCSGTNQNNGFPYTWPSSQYYNSYNPQNCSTGFSCFAFVYEAGRQAGINWGSWTPGNAGAFITQFGTISLSSRRIGDLILYNFDQDQNQYPSNFNEHVAIITQVNSTDPREDMVISCFGAHEFFEYGVGECKSWGFHSTSNQLPSGTKGLFAPAPSGYWLPQWDQWDFPNDVRIVRIIN